MPVIEIVEEHEPTTYLEHVLEDDDGLIRDITRIETIREVAEGDICDIFYCHYNDQPAVLKMAKSRSDNDLVQQEATVLKSLKHDRTLRHLYSGLYEGKAYNIIEAASDFYTLAEVLKTYPNGLDFQDAIWMFNRTLEGLGKSHTEGVIHGAVTPKHIMVRMGDHKGILIDWSYSVLEPQHRMAPASVVPPPVSALCAEYRDYYPPEVFRKDPAAPPHDIYMASKVMIALLGGNVATNEMPSSVPELLQETLLKTLTTRTRDRAHGEVLTFHREIREVMQILVGPRKFRPFTMPHPPRIENA